MPELPLPGHHGVSDELVVRDLRHSRGGVVLERGAFGRNPRAVTDASGAEVIVGGENPDNDGAQTIVDGDQLDAALPSPSLQPARWAGLPDQWEPGWSSGAGVGPAALTKRVSTVFTCNDLNARALGSMPPALSRGGRPMNPATYDWTENPEPMLYASWEEFMAQAVVSLGTRGDLFVHATAWDPTTFLPNRFMVLDPDQVTVQFGLDGRREYTLAGAPLYPGDLMHVRYLSMAGWPTGLSPLQGAAGNLRSAAALEQYGAGLAEEGGLTWGVLTSDQRITDRQALKAQDQWAQSSRRRRGAPAVLGNGLKLDTLTLSPKDMALLDLRVFDEQRIAAAYGVPPFLIGLPQPDGLTYANATSLFDFHWRGMLRPMGRKITAALSAWCLPRGVKLTLNAGDYVQPPLSERTTSYKAMHEAGALTTNEWRALEGLPPLPGAEHDTASRAPADGQQGQGRAAEVAAVTEGTATLQ